MQAERSAVFRIQLAYKLRFVDVDQDTDRRIGAIEVKQRARDAKCRACMDQIKKDLDLLKRDVEMARVVRRLVSVATVFALLCVVLAIALV